MFEIEVHDEFSAAHALRLYDGTWETRHGHNWKVSVVMRSEKLDRIGVVVDFEWLKPALRGVLKEFETISFNEHIDFKNDRLNPSTENIAKTICDRLKVKVPAGNNNACIVKVTVWETPDASATYFP